MLQPFGTDLNLYQSLVVSAWYSQKLFWRAEGKMLSNTVQKTGLVSLLVRLA